VPSGTPSSKGLYVGRVPIFARTLRKVGFHYPKPIVILILADASTRADTPRIYPGGWPSLSGLTHAWDAPSLSPCFWRDRAGILISSCRSCRPLPLSLMKLVAGARRGPPQIHSFAQTCQCAFARTTVGLALASLTGLQLGCAFGLHENFAVAPCAILRLLFIFSLCLCASVVKSVLPA